MVYTEIVKTPLPPWSETPTESDTGAEIVFHGRVRGLEGDKKIIGLFYEVYEDMAVSELNTLADAAMAKFKIQDLICLHRVGMVKVGEASLRVIIRSKHRSSGFEALEWFISNLKKTVPIWKWGVLPSGEKFPSKHAADC